MNERLKSIQKTKKDLPGFDGKPFTEQEIFDLKYAMDSSNDNLQSLLLRMMMKADQYNTERLRLGYPRQMAMVEAWRRGEIEP